MIPLICHIDLHHESMILLGQGRVQDFSQAGGVDDVGPIAGYSPLY